MSAAIIGSSFKELEDERFGVVNSCSCDERSEVWCKACLTKFCQQVRQPLVFNMIQTSQTKNESSDQQKEAS